MEQSTVAILILCITIILFISQKVPLAPASLLGALLMMMAGILTPEELCGSFGSYICVLLACSGIISAAAFETGLADKLGDLIFRCRLLVANEKRFLAVIILLSGTMSMFVANIPVVALFIPIAAAVAAKSQGKISKKNILMAVGFAATMGGNGTLIGASTNMTGSASLQATTGQSLQMFTMLPITVVLIAVMILYYMTVGYRLEKRVFQFPDPNDIAAEDKGTEHDFHPRKAAIVTVAFFFMMASFLAGLWDFGTVSMVSAAACVVSGCISWKKALENVDWSTVVVVGSSLALASAMNTSGGGLRIAEALLQLCGGENASPMLMLGVAIVSSSLISCFMQNNAVVAVLIPIFCTIATVIGSNPLAFAVAIICGCNICYGSPISTSPITMTLVGGYRFNDYVKVGGILQILTIIAALIVMPIFYPL